MLHQCVPDSPVTHPIRTIGYRRARWCALLLIAAIAPALAPAEAQSTCAGAFSDSLSQHTLRAFELAADVPPVWDDYRFSRHPLLLLADSTHRGRPATPVCAAIWRSDTPLEVIELAARPAFSTPLYGMINADPIGPGAVAGASDLGGTTRRASPAVATALRARGVTRVVALNVPLRFGSLGRLGEMLQSANADPARIQADLAVHESFHLQVQFPTWLDQPRTYAWPAWDVQPDRAELRQRCYAGSQELIAAMESEVGALLAAYDAVHADPATRDSALGLREALRFVELRLARRALQDTITVSRPDRRISCGAAEDLMELEEGATQWIGHATSLRAGLTTRATLRRIYAAAQAEKFYQLGPLQFWVLDGLLGTDAVRQITASIARSTGPDGPAGGVHAQFEYQIRRLAAARP
jgi:hypothetical protein